MILSTSSEFSFSVTDVDYLARYLMTEQRDGRVLRMAAVDGDAQLSHTQGRSWKHFSMETHELNSAVLLRVSHTLCRDFCVSAAQVLKFHPLPVAGDLKVMHSAAISDVLLLLLPSRLLVVPQHLSAAVNTRRRLLHTNVDAVFPLLELPLLVSLSCSLALSLSNIHTYAHAQTCTQRHTQTAH